MQTTVRGMAFGRLIWESPSRTKDDRQEELVRDRIEPKAEPRFLMIDPGREAVENVRQPGKKEDDERRPGPAVEHHLGEHRNEQDPGQGQEIGNETAFFPEIGAHGFLCVRSYFISSRMTSSAPMASEPPTTASGRKVLPGPRSMI